MSAVLSASLARRQRHPNARLELRDAIAHSRSNPANDTQLSGPAARRPGLPGPRSVARSHHSGAIW
jgi:hypothetical protein